ncbi:MAG: aminotransferase class I/II-fold pyridoxal phosphate-dependent enzyme [Ardenticatenia bacterium]|nr:aminotransferase class I/II-fold pyridoxal phosphate-dependent enzyme [Ardenticatenia bacterium]
MPWPKLPASPPWPTEHTWSAQSRAYAVRQPALRADLSAAGLDVLPSTTHFFLVRVGDASAFRTALAKHGVLVRDCTSFGLPAHVRVSSRRPEENRRLVEAVQAALRGQGQAHEDS